MLTTAGFLLNTISGAKNVLLLKHPTMEKLISLEKITKVYKTSKVETLALHKINLNIAQGEFVSLMGTSGSGKSTLLHIIGMLDTPTKGTYSFNEVDLESQSVAQRTDLRKYNIGFIFQDFNLIDDLTVFENVELAFTLFKTKQKRTGAKSDGGANKIVNDA